jgi:hypothetical protein
MLNLKLKFVMNNHDLIIYFFILIIIAIQVYVFFSSLQKINILKSIFPDIRNFKTIKVNIPEELINTITPEDVFRIIKEAEIVKAENVSLPKKAIPAIREEKTVESDELLYRTNEAYNDEKRY